jgi:hypothetical protein
MGDVVEDELKVGDVVLRMRCNLEISIPHRDQVMIKRPTRWCTLISAQRQPDPAWRTFVTESWADPGFAAELGARLDTQRDVPAPDTGNLRSDRDERPARCSGRARYRKWPRRFPRCPAGQPARPVPSVQLIGLLD